MSCCHLYGQQILCVRSQSISGEEQNMATTNATPTFADAGTLFNDATRFLEGGLWQNTVEEGGQGLGSVGSVVTDLQTVQADLQAGVAASQYTGQALTDVQSILTSVGQEITAANASVNGGGSFGSVAAAETALRNLHLGVLNTVAADPTLATAATANGATGFQAVPAGFAAGVTAQNAPHANLADIGAIFNDAANLMIGGVNSSNIDAIRADVNAAQTDLKQLMAAHPDEFGGLTGVHADTVVRQLALENKFLNQVGTNPDAGRASNDNMLDIIDIVQGDTNLANMANQNGVSGFSAFPDSINPNPKYQDNADQTNFWSNFIAQSNSLGQAAENAVASGDKATINSLITQIKAFETNSANFDMSQGGIFEARFDNELAKGSSTLGAEVAAIIKGLKTGNAALVTAAAEEMHANAADVGGNNLPVNGGTYNTDGLTAADVLGQATATAAATPAAAGAAQAGAAAATAATTAAGGAAQAATAPAAAATTTAAGGTTQAATTPAAATTTTADGGAQTGTAAAAPATTTTGGAAQAGAAPAAADAAASGATTTTNQAAASPATAQAAPAGTGQATATTTSTAAQTAGAADAAATHAASAPTAQAAASTGATTASTASGAAAQTATAAASHDGGLAHDLGFQHTHFHVDHFGHMWG
jgi:hypothetical protein